MLTKSQANRLRGLIAALVQARTNREFEGGPGSDSFFAMVRSEKEIRSKLNRYIRELTEK